MSEYKTPWPTVGDTAFAARFDFDDIDLGWLRVEAKDADLAEGFRLMGDLAVRALESGAERSPERLFFAVAYNYRHSVELWLKTLVRHGQVLEIVGEQPSRLLERHDLGALWTWTRCVLEAFFAGDDPTPLLVAEKVVMEFHVLDRSGQEFRYARDKQGRPHLANAPKNANLLELGRVMAGVCTFLESCSMALGVAVEHHEQMRLEYEAEMRREYEADMRSEYASDCAGEQEDRS